MKKTGLPRIAWVLAGLLAISAGLLSLGQQDQEAAPDVTSYGPSGISAFVELAKRQGADVSVNLESNPRLGTNDVAVAFDILPTRGEDTVGEDTPEQQFEDHFWQFIRHGGTGIVLPLREDFLEASRTAAGLQPLSVTDPDSHRTFKVTSSGIVPDESFPVEDDAVSVSLWKDDSGQFLRAYRLGKGTALVGLDGIGITNRFIDKNDNAKAFTALLALVAKPGKRIVFTEASFGKIDDPGLMQTVGPWANAAWQQLIVLGFVVVFTLGKRFGLPDEVRNPQRGTRELLDGIADTFLRARSPRIALTTAATSADTELRRVLKLPKDAGRADRDRLLPSSLQNALHRLQIAGEQPNVTSAQALDLIVATQREMAAFVGPSRAKLRSLAKLGR